MTTKADFYDGCGSHAVWLGSLQGDADPETVRRLGCGRLLLAATDPFTYADAVADLLDVWADEDLGHGYHPRDGWPWQWPDSRTTDWVFTFTHGRVWATTGSTWLTQPWHARCPRLALPTPPPTANTRRARPRITPTPATPCPTGRQP